ncbi:MAG TPA: glycosyltransferase family 2 protein [Candidatus Paceibacterota bacterium]
MAVAQKPYLHSAHATDLTGRDYILYRALEIVPGAISWATLGGMVLASYAVPTAAAFFIIIFDIYWLVKTIFLSFHLRANMARMRSHLDTDWQALLGRMRWEHLWQLVLLPMSKESYTVVHDSVASLTQCSWPKDRMVVVLSYEERFGEHGKEIARRMYEEFQNEFPHLYITEHPAGLPSEMPGKGSNESWAANCARTTFIDPRAIPYHDILVSSLDIDTRVPSNYFEVVSWHFLTARDSLHTSYQPVPVYNNNIWEASALSRVVATSGTFWQMMQQERPERLTTFSSHSMSFKALADLGYWQKNMVSEDSRIFWNALLYYDGNYTSTPLSYPVYMDANIGGSFWETVKNVYRQQRRWAWGAENFPYVAFGFLNNKQIPLRTKLYYMFNLLEGYWSWATNALLIFALGWLPLMLGGREFNELVLAYNLPYVTRTIMTFAMVGLVTSAIMSLRLLPPRPSGYPRRRFISMVLQWILVPFTIIIFGAIPALDAQTRLMLGKYMGFWITPKPRKIDKPGLSI